jgi:hypothetical protein
MACSLVPSVHGMLLTLVASFIYDQVEAIVKDSRKLVVTPNGREPL